MENVNSTIDISLQCVSPDDLQAVLEVSAERAQWEGPVLECD